MNVAIFMSGEPVKVEGEVIVAYFRVQSYHSVSAFEETHEKPLSM
jgi:hypothetical protein